MARHPYYLKYNQYALSSVAKKAVQKAQHTVPKGEQLIAWTPLAFHLDYGHNKIIDIDPAGLANPWVDFPFGAQSSEGIKYFTDLGVHYFLWHYKSYAIRTEQMLLNRSASAYPRERAIGIKTHQFVKMLNKMAETSEILYDNGEIRVMKLEVGGQEL